MSVLAGFKSAVDASATGAGVSTLDAVGRTPATSVVITDADCVEPVYLAVLLRVREETGANSFPSGSTITSCSLSTSTVFGGRPCLLLHLAV